MLQVRASAEGSMETSKTYAGGWPCDPKPQNERWRAGWHQSRERMSPRRSDANVQPTSQLREDESLKEDRTL